MLGKERWISRNRVLVSITEAQEGKCDVCLEQRCENKTHIAILPTYLGAARIDYSLEATNEP